MNTQAQEALKIDLNKVRATIIERTYLDVNPANLIDESIKATFEACKEALAQPAQEPVNNCPNCNSWFTKEIHSIPAPSWQELSDDEIESLYEKIKFDVYVKDIVIDFSRAIEQELKEKNT